MGARNDQKGESKTIAGRCKERKKKKTARVRVVRRERSKRERAPSSFPDDCLAVFGVQRAHEETIRKIERQMRGGE